MYMYVAYHFLEGVGLGEGRGGGGDGIFSFSSGKSRSPTASNIYNIEGGGGLEGE